MSVAANKELRNLNRNRKGLDQAFKTSYWGKNIETLAWWRLLKNSTECFPALEWESKLGD